MTTEQCAAAHAALQARMDTPPMRQMAAVRAALPIAQFRCVLAGASRARADPAPR
jgi:hypothetical protein